MAQLNIFSLQQQSLTMPFNMVAPLTVTFLDLQNAFGSVAHELITDILAHIKLPDNLVSYISDGYSKLTEYVKTK